MFIIVLFLNAIFLLAKVEFQFTELRSGESVTGISRTVGLFPLQTKATKRLFCLRVEIGNVQLACFLN